MSAFETTSYEAILTLPHPVSDKYPKMSLKERAAQFSPFAALTGHADAIKETERLAAERYEDELTGAE